MKEEENVHFACQNDVRTVACPFISILNWNRKVKTYYKFKGKGILD